MNLVPALHRIVVVGNGIAGLTAADTLRESGFDGELIVIGDEPRDAYSRPALSKAALGELGEMTAHLLPPPEHGAETFLGVHVTGLDESASELVLSDGKRMSFDGLVIATGIRPRKLRPDLDIETTFRHVDDALTLRDRLVSRPRVVVIGAGVLGMELASSCRAAGCEVTVVSRRKPLVAFFGDYLADIFVAAATKHGITWESPEAVDVGANDSSNYVVLADGREIEADLVITAIGDVPNTEWLAGSGLLTDGELAVDSRGRVRPNIVAAGDVAAIDTPHGRRRVPLWTSAIEQAKTAARALLQGDDAEPLAFQPYFWTDQFGLNLKACGELPVSGTPGYSEGDASADAALLRWHNADGTGTAVALNYRIPVPKLRALSRQAPVAS